MSLAIIFLFFDNFFFIFYVHWFFAYMYVRVKVLDPLDLELQRVVSGCVGAGT